MEDKAIDEANCIDVNEGKMVTLNDHQRAAPIHCLKLVISQKARKNVRLQTVDMDVSFIGNAIDEKLEELSKKIMVRKTPFPTTDDDDECEDGQCLEVQAAIDFDDFWGYFAFYIGELQGGDDVFIRFLDSRLKLYGVSVTTAIEDAGIDKMNELDEKEHHILFRDIPKAAKSEPFNNKRGWLSIDISQWLAEKYGGSSQKFKVTVRTLYYKWELDAVDCTFRGDAPIDCLVHYPWGGGLDQDICITKVDDDEVADPVPQESKADSVAIDDLLDFESATFVSQIGHSVVQNPWISHSIVFGIGCLLPTIFKAIIKKMAPRRVRRRIMRPQMLSQNQGDENMRNLMMTDDV